MKYTPISPMVNDVPIEFHDPNAAIFGVVVIVAILIGAYIFTKKQMK